MWEALSTARRFYDWLRPELSFGTIRLITNTPSPPWSMVVVPSCYKEASLQQVQESWWRHRVNPGRKNLIHIYGFKITLMFWEWLRQSPDLNSHTIAINTFIWLCRDLFSTWHERFFFCRSLSKKPNKSTMIQCCTKIKGENLQWGWAVMCTVNIVL